MAKPFASLASDAIRTSGRLVYNVNNHVKAVAIAVHEEEVLAMPVDIGTTRSNWVASLTAPHVGELTAYAPGSHLGIAETANAEGAIQQGRNVIGSRQPGEGSVYLVNNTEYIGRINSPQVNRAPMSLVIADALLRGLSRVGLLRETLK